MFKEIEELIKKYKDGITADDRQDLLDKLGELFDAVNEVAEKIADLPELAVEPEEVPDRILEREKAKRDRMAEAMLVLIKNEKLDAKGMAKKFIEADIVMLADFLGLEASASDKEIETATKIAKKLKENK